MKPWLACQEGVTSTGIGSGVFSVRFPRCGRLAAAWGPLLALVAGACLAQAQWLTQEITLRPGWNAVHLSVQPARNDCSSVLAGLPVESVWMWSRRTPRLHFTTDPSQLLPRNPDWLFWLPASHPQTSLGTLFSIQGGRSYLIRLASDAPAITWKIQGIPVVFRRQWLAQAVNLTGLPVRSAGATFEEFFRPATAIGLTRADGGEIYQVSSTGEGTRVWEPSRTRIQPGVAYWIRCKEPTAYTGPLRVELDYGSVLEFPTGVWTRRLKLSNDGRTPSTVTVRPWPSEAAPPGSAPVAGQVPLSYREQDWSQGLPKQIYRALEPALSRSLAPGETWVLELTPRRQEMREVAPGASWQSLLEVTDGVTVRQWVGVVAQ